MAVQSNGDVWVEWLVVPFSTDNLSIGFNKEFKTKPVVTTQVYNGSSNTSVDVKLQSYEDEGLIRYSGLSIKGNGSGDDIAIHIIGRV